MRRDTLIANLYTGETTTRTLTITNAGLGDLSFQVAIKPVEGLKALALECVQGINPTGKVVENGRERTTFTESELAQFKQNLERYYQQVKAVRRGRSISSIAIVGGYTWDIAYQLLNDTALVDQYVFYPVSNYYDYSFIKDYDGLMVCESYGGIALDEAAAVRTYPESGRPILMGLEGLGYESLQIQGLVFPIFNVTPVAEGYYYPGAFNPNSPMAAGVSCVSSFCCSNGNYALSGADWIFSGSDGNYYGVYSTARGGSVLIGGNVYYFWSAGNSKLIENAINWLMQRCRWLSVLPLFGNISSGRGVDLSMQFDAGLMYGGDFHANIAISSNDPDEPVVLIPARLRVTGAPDITLSTDSLNYDSVYITGARTDSIAITNDGAEVLTATSVVIDNADFRTSMTGFSLNPGENLTLPVTFAPGSLGIIKGALIITSNDPDEGAFTVFLTGVGVEPPRIAVSPDSVGDSLLTGQTSTKTITISNTGKTDLTFSIAVENAAPLPWSIKNDQNQIRLSSPSVSDFAGGKKAAYTGAEMSVLRHSLSPQLAGDSSRYGIGIDSVRNAPYSRSVNLPFFDGFEDGDYDGWFDDVGSDVFKEVTDSTAAEGNRSLYMRNTNYGGPFGGIHQEFPDSSRPTYVGFYVRPGSTSATSCFFVLTDHARWLTAIDFQATYSIFSINGDESFSCQSLRWYHVELKEIDWTGKVFDYYVDGQLTKAGLRFRNQDDVNDFGGLYLFNYHYQADAWWDGIQIGKIAWLEPTPVSGTIPAGSQMDITVVFGADHLLGGDYHANIVISSNDPSDPRDTVPAYLHVTGVPDIALSRDSLSYPPVFIGASANDSLAIISEGTDVLVVNHLVFSADFSADTSGFSLGVGERQILHITFAPSTPGLITGALTIGSNDPDEPVRVVALLGTAVQSPDIAVVPAQISDSLLIGQSTTDTLFITNTGASDLFWNASAQFAERSAVAQASPTFNSTKAKADRTKNSTHAYSRPDADEIFASSPLEIAGAAEHAAKAPLVSLGDILANLDADYQDVINAIPQRFEFEEGDTGYLIVDGGYDMYDNANILGTNFGYPLYYSNDSIITSPYLGASGKYFTRKYPGLFVMAADIDGISYVEILGDLGADGYWGSTDGVVLQAVVNGAAFLGFVKRVYDAGDPSVNHLIIVEDNLAVMQEFSTNTNDDYHRVFYLSESKRIYYLLYAGEGGFYIDNAAALNIMNAFLHSIKLAPEYVTLSPAADTVSPGSSVAVSVGLNATGLLIGDYHANIVISSNDPDEARVLIPTDLQVSGVPRIAASTDSLKFGQICIGFAAAETLTVTNSGSDLLIVDRIVSDNAEYSPGDTSLTLNIGESRQVVITMRPTTAAVIEGILSLHSNDPDDSVVTVHLLGEGVYPPDISVSPDSLAFTMNSSDSSMGEVTIANTGLGPLNFHITAFNSAPLLASKSSRTATILKTTGEVSDSRQRLANYGPLYLPEIRMNASRQAAEVLLIEDVAPWGTVANEAILQNNGINYDRINSTSIDSTEFLRYRAIIIPGDQYQSYYDVVQAHQSKFDSFVASGGVLEFHAAGWGWNLGNPTAITLPGGMRINYEMTSVNYVLAPNHPVAQGVASPFFGNYANHAAFSNVPVEALSIVSDGDLRLDLVEYRFGSGLVIASGHTLEFGYAHGEPAETILQNLIPCSASSAHLPWLLLNPDAGSVAPGESTTVQLKVKPGEISGGIYYARLDVSSNDPYQSTVTVPLALHVIGVPDIDIISSNIYFGAVPLGGSLAKSLRVINVGTDILVVSSVSVHSPDFGVDVASFSVNPGAHRDVHVTFAPSALGIFRDTLKVISNDPDEPQLAVSLEGIGSNITPPDTCRVIAGAFGPVAIDSGACDTIRIGCRIAVPTIVPDDSIPIPVYLWSDANIAAFTLGFAHNSEMVEITSWSANGSVIPPDTRPYAGFRAEPDFNRFLMAWIDMTGAMPIPPSSEPHAQLLGTLYMRAIAGATPQIIDLDSTFIPPAAYWVLSHPPVGSIFPLYVDCGVNDIYLGMSLPANCGDADGDDIINVSDVVYLVAYIFSGGPAPSPLENGDPNCNDLINVSDVVHMISYVFSGGPAPCAGC